MTTERATEKMIVFYRGNMHDICHFLKVWSYARSIGLLEGLDPDTQLTLELTAIVHDIAIPFCRKKYGHCEGSLQERESEPILREFFGDDEIEPERLERIISLVTRHHTYTGVDGIDNRILLEADFLVNADEGGMSEDAIRKGRELIYRTVTGTRFLDEMYLTKYTKD